MAYGKSIELFLVNGTADSLVTAELSNWNGKAIKIPQIEVADAKRPELMGPGVYLLFCKEEGKSDSVYIGEAENVQDRLIRHMRDYQADKEKYYWTTAVIFKHFDKKSNGTSTAAKIKSIRYYFLVTERKKGYYKSRKRYGKGDITMNIVVLAGGLSTERDVSFKTGEMVTKALRENGHQVIMLDVFMGYSDKEEELTGIFARGEEVSVQVESIPETVPDLAKIKAMRKDQTNSFFGPNVIELCRMSDIVFMALHGENGEDGRIQAAFDLFDIRYTGTGYLSSALAMDKGVSKQLFLRNGIPTPKGVSIKKSAPVKSVEALGLKLPCVVKPCCGGSSIGVSMIHSEKELTKGLADAFLWEDELIIEEYIKGREFSVGVIDFQALPVIEIAPVEGFYDYKNKYKAGSAIETCPADLPEEISAKMRNYAEAVASVLGLTTYSRSDFLLSQENEIFCLEANTLPGMTPTSLLPQEAQAVGMNFNQLCEKLIEISLHKYNR